MCGRIIQSSGPLRLAIVEGLHISDSRMGNVLPRYNAAPGQEPLVIRQNQRQASVLIDTANAVILDVETSRAIRQAEVGAARTPG